LAGWPPLLLRGFKLCLCIYFGLLFSNICFYSEVLISSIIQIYDLSRGNFNNIGCRKPIVKPIGARTTLTHRHNFFFYEGKAPFENEEEEGISYSAAADKGCTALLSQEEEESSIFLTVKRVSNNSEEQAALTAPVTAITKLMAFQYCL
jgi:hypothetical protein